MRYDRNERLLSRARSGELRKAEIRTNWGKFSPALVLTFNGGEEQAVRHTAWLPFLKEIYVSRALGPELCDWAMELAERARR